MFLRRLRETIFGNMGHMERGGVKSLCACLLLIIALAWVHDAWAEGWRLLLTEHPNNPSVLLTVNKEEQQTFLFAQKSPLALLGKYTCTTGSKPGDKLRRGDLRTPEGVYFVEKRITSGLDFELYGGKAYPLNYPNPVDKLKGKTGSGIWLHGRGKPLVPRDTKGCVALDNKDLGQLEASLALGTPVVIAREVDWSRGPSPEQEQAKTALVERVQDWAASWERKSDDFFGFYDAERYTKSRGQAFRHFADHKRNVFSRTPWLQVLLHDIRVVEGPDYWVTYFQQYYRTPEIASQGLKRLYWQKDESGEFRIVGREWSRRNLGLEEHYLERMRGELRSFVEEWRASWEKGNLDGYLSHYAADAEQGERSGREAIGRHKEGLWLNSPPEKVQVASMDVRMHPEGLVVDFVQTYQSQDGFEDRGRKTLVVRPFDGEWRIVQEDWSALQ